MCGRLILPKSTADVLEEFDISTGNEYHYRPHTPYERVVPGENIPVVVNNKQNTFPVLTSLFWGVGYSQPIYNARVETAPLKKMWSSPYRFARVLVPVFGFFERDKLRGSHYIFRNAEDTLLTLGGLLVRQPEKPDSVAILTMESPDEYKAIHNRFPVIVEECHVSEWLDREVTDVDRIHHMAFSQLPDFDISQTQLLNDAA